MPLQTSLIQALPAAVGNPLDGVVPSFTIFGAEFTTLWQKLAAGLWGVGILIAIFYLGRSVLSIAQARQSAHPGALEGAKKDAAHSGLALGGLVALAAVVGIVLAVFNI